MDNVLTAIDEPGATILMSRLAALAGTVGTSGSNQLGLITLNHSIHATLQTGAVDLIPSNQIGLERMALNYTLHASLQLDLNQILPAIYFPEVTVTFTSQWPFFSVSIAWVQYPWPVLNIPFAITDNVAASAKLQLVVRNDAANWYVLAKVQALPNFNFGPGTAAILAAVGAGLVAAVAWLPLVGLFLATVTAAVFGVLTVAGLTGFLTLALAPVVQGREFMLYQQPRKLQLLPYQDAYNPDANVQITMVEASIVNNGEDELEIHVVIEQ